MTFLDVGEGEPELQSPSAAICVTSDMAWSLVNHPTPLPLPQWPLWPCAVKAPVAALHPHGVQPVWGCDTTWHPPATAPCPHRALLRHREPCPGEGPALGFWAGGQDSDRSLVRSPGVSLGSQQTCTRRQAWPWIWGPPSPQPWEALGSAPTWPILSGLKPKRGRAALDQPWQELVLENKPAGFFLHPPFFPPLSTIDSLNMRDKRTFQSPPAYPPHFMHEEADPTRGVPCPVSLWVGQGRAPWNQAPGSVIAAPSVAPEWGAVSCLAEWAPITHSEFCSRGQVSPLGWCVQAVPLLSPQELGLLQDYLLALTTDDHLLRCAAQVLPPTQCQPAAAASLWQATPHHHGRTELLCLGLKHGIHPALTWSSVPIQLLPGAVRESSQPPFLCDIHTKLWGQKTLTRICVF